MPAAEHFLVYLNGTRSKQHYPGLRCVLFTVRRSLPGMKRYCRVLLLLFQVVGLRVSAEESFSAQEIVERMADQADEMERVAQDWGYWRESLEKKLDGKNHVVEEKKKLRRTIWLEGKPYLELVKVNDKDLNTDGLKEEAKEKAKFLKEVRIRRRRILTKKTSPGNS